VQRHKKAHKYGKLTAHTLERGGHKGRTGGKKEKGKKRGWEERRPVVRWQHQPHRTAQKTIGLSDLARGRKLKHGRKDLKRT